MGFGARRSREVAIHSDQTDQSVLSIGGAARLDIAALEVVQFEALEGWETWVEFFMPWNSSGTLGGTVRAHISDGVGADAASAVKATGHSAEARAANSSVGQVRAVERIVAPGIYTRRPQVGASLATGASAGMLASAVVKPTFRVYRVLLP